MKTKKEDYGLDGLVVKKHSVLGSLTRFNISERRLFDFCLQYYDSRKDARNPRVFSVPVEEFKKAFPQYQKYFPIDFFNLCLDAANGIQAKPYKPHTKKAIYWFEQLELSEDNTEILFSLTSRIMPFFLELQSRFIEYHMRDVRFLNKPLAWSLYEYLKEKYLNGDCPEWTVEVFDLKNRLGSGDKYSRFSNFENLCLKRPQADINEYTDLKFSYDKIKKGRTVVKIRFRVIQKALDSVVIDTEDLGKVFARELSLAGINKTITDRFVQAATDRNLTSSMLGKLPKIKKSWGKNGGKPYSAYLSGVLNKELLEMDLFETSKKEKEKKEMDAIQKELRKQQEEDVRLQEQQMSQKALRQLEQDHPEKYQKLYDQAARDLGINPDRLKRGDKPKIIFKMLESQTEAE